MCCVFGIDYIMYVENERFTKIMFLLDRVQNNSSNWNSQVKNTLESLDMESTYTNFTSCSLHYTCREKVIHVRTNFKTELLHNIQVCMYQNFRHIHCLYSFFNPAIQIHTRKIRHARSLKTLQIKTGSV